jgi:hypothetical protein
MNEVNMQPVARFIEIPRQNGSPQITGNVGMYFVAYQLSRRGWNAMPTARNARGIDILAYDANAERKLGIQIKTVSKTAAIPLGIKPLDRLMGDWWIIVASATSEPECFILTPDEVRVRAVRDQGGAQAYWLPRRQYAAADFREAWHRIGHGD